MNDSLCELMILIHRRFLNLFLSVLLNNQCHIHHCMYNAHQTATAVKLPTVGTTIMGHLVHLHLFPVISGC